MTYPRCMTRCSLSLCFFLGAVALLTVSACGSNESVSTGSGGGHGTGGDGNADLSGAGGQADATGGGAANTGGGSNDGSGGQALTGSIADLVITANPNNVLSAWVTWTTSDPADSVVQLGKDALTLEVVDTELTTEHKVLVIGMRAETEYQMRALSTGASGTLEGKGKFTTGPLPAQIPVATVSVAASDKTQPGWTLMNVQKGDGTNRAISGAPPAAVIYDEEGQPVWYFINGTTTERGGAISVDPTDRGIIMGPTLSGGSGPAFGPVEVDWAGDTVWACEDPLCNVPDQLSHHAGKLSNGNYIVMRDASASGRTSQIFLEFSSNSATPVHQIGVEDAMMPPQTASGDWAHGNSITVDVEKDVAYMSFRWLGVIKMKYSTQEMLWHLPASYGQDNLGVDFGDMAFDPPTSQYTDIHDPEIHDDGTILFFDNGGYSGVIEDGNPGNRHTRAVEYLIDETAKVAQLVWEWPGSFDVDPWYTTDLYVPFWGDADRLANGNVLIAAGRRGTTAATPESRIIEVARSGEVVWELKLPPDHGVYRAERLYPLPVVRPIQ